MEKEHGDDIASTKVKKHSDYGKIEWKVVHAIR